MSIKWRDIEFIYYASITASQWSSTVKWLLTSLIASPFNIKLGRFVKKSVSPDLHWQNTFMNLAYNQFCKNTWSRKYDKLIASFTNQEVN